ncbi:3-carboxyethylcatechol 2,3-dioxygenase [Pseudomonas sp. 5Ae-yellow]|uniref:3-carboxyethylcatechol 2,3-dioxygenase n=1 Tax=Pseudomonas sp. 5Ae-yellow TaxID=2759848 RepID=UPI0015F631D7|nr:3-carboxyethylcatechol 2,3-dioxygenase [Pseudomonas sp. 5Ae-yellow]MBA6420967.1 3-carboxyethylcatechol 2,3-dioxygenase [Pseudomonas sp. 5Ae-yellow]
MSVLLQCLSHTPLAGHFDPAQRVLAEVDGVVAAARDRIEAFQPELVILFAPDHYNGFFYDVMPSFCIGTAAHAIGDFGTLAGPLAVPKEIAEACAQAVLEAGVDVALSYRMQVDHGFAQPLELLLGGLDRCPVIPVFINSVAVPLPGFQRARLLGEAIGCFARTLGKRVLILGSGGLSHQPPVPELAKVDERMADRLMGSGRNLPPDERQARQLRVITAAERFVEDQNSLHPLNPDWDQQFLKILANGDLTVLDSLSNAELSNLAGKSTHEVKTWVAAFAALSVFGPYATEARYYRPIPEWIAGFGALGARPQSIAKES